MFCFSTDTGVSLLALWAWDHPWLVLAWHAAVFLAGLGVGYLVWGN